jgi:oligopeptide transport system permease protein
MLSYLGIVKLGSAQKTSLGTLLSDASTIWTNYPHLLFFPALTLSLLMICFNLFGNGLRDAFNPALRGTE